MNRTSASSVPTSLWRRSSHGRLAWGPPCHDGVGSLPPSAAVKRGLRARLAPRGAGTGRRTLAVPLAAGPRGGALAVLGTPVPPAAALPRARLPGPFRPLHAPAATVCLEIFCWSLFT